MSDAELPTDTEPSAPLVMLAQQSLYGLDESTRARLRALGPMLRPLGGAVFSRLVERVGALGAQSPLTGTTEGRDALIARIEHELGAVCGDIDTPLLSDADPIARTHAEAFGADVEPLMYQVLHEVVTERLMRATVRGSDPRLSLDEVREGLIAVDRALSCRRGVFEAMRTRRAAPAPPPAPPPPAPAGPSLPPVVIAPDVVLAQTLEGIITLVERAEAQAVASEVEAIEEDHLRLGDCYTIVAGAAEACRDLSAQFAASASTGDTLRVRSADLTDEAARIEAFAPALETLDEQIALVLVKLQIQEARTTPDPAQMTALVTQMRAAGAALRDVCMHTRDSLHASATSLATCAQAVDEVGSVQAVVADARGLLTARAETLDTWRHQAVAENDRLIARYARLGASEVTRTHVLDAARAVAMQLRGPHAPSPSPECVGNVSAVDGGASDARDDTDPLAPPPQEALASL